jgi:hypothetical protein
VVYGVALCYRTTPYNRYPYTFLHIALHSCHSGHLHWLLRSSLGGCCSIPECRCHNISKKMTLWIFWLMGKLGVFIVRVLLHVTVDFRNWVPSSLLHCRCKKSIFTVLILVLFCQISWYSCTQFAVSQVVVASRVDKSIGVDKSQIVTHHFYKIISHTHAAFTYVPEVLGWQVPSLSGMSIQPFSNSLHIYLTAALSLCHHHSLCQLVLNFYGGHISHVKAEIHYKHTNGAIESKGLWCNAGCTGTCIALFLSPLL